MANLTGTSGGDVLNGTTGADTIRGRGGNDFIAAGDGDDYIEDGFGDDIVGGGNGADRIISTEGGNDRFYGEAGNDQFRIIRARSDVSETVVVDGGSDDDYLYYSNRNDGRLFANMGSGNDIVDLYNLQNGGAFLTLGSGQDVLVLQRQVEAAGNVVTIADFQAGDSGDRIELEPFLGGTLQGWSGNVNPFADNHLRLVTEGTSTLLQLNVSGTGSSFVTLIRFENVAAGSLTAFNLGGFASNGAAVAGQTFTGGTGADTLTGTVGADTINGGGGDDRLSGRTGNDTIYGGDGADFLEDGSGDDIVYGGNGNDYFSSNEGGSDTLYGDAGNDRFFVSRSDRGTTENLRIFGGNENDTLVYQNYNAGSLIADMGAGDDRVTLWTVQTGGAQIALGGGRDVIEFTSLLNTATNGVITVTDFQTGSDGDRLEWDQYLNSTLLGWNGSDNPFGANYLRLVSSGADTLLQLDVNGTGTSFTTIVRFQNTTPQSFDASNFNGFPPNGSAVAGQTFVGTDVSDTLFGSNGGDTIDGNAGNDLLFGYAGNDTINGGDGDDNIEDGAGNDVARGGAGGDIFSSSDGGSDRLYGEDGNDEFYIIRSDRGAVENIEIYGGIDNDSLTFENYNSGSLVADMGSGDDSVSLWTVQDGGARITLGTGRDTVKFVSSLQIDGNLVITDFQTGNSGDRLDWNGFLNNTLTGWNGNDNPFTTGHVRLLQVGSATAIQTLNAQGGYQTIATLENTTATSFTSFNLDGFAANGGQVIVGTPGNDFLVGTTGDDRIEGQDGIDTIRGNLGNDTIDGGSSVDYVRVTGIQSQYVVTQTETGVFQISGLDGIDMLTRVEYLQFDDALLRLLPGSGVQVTFGPNDASSYQPAMENIRDFSGNDLGGDGAWMWIGSADVNGDGDTDQILVNAAIGRFATVGTGPDGLVYFSDYSWAGETRVAGIYIDPLVASGQVNPGSDFDSQARFQNDLFIGNIGRVLGAGDYDGDGLQEVYFALSDGTAYLHAYMHADGNIRYANYQSEAQVRDFLTGYGYGEETFGDWFSNGAEPLDAKATSAAFETGDMTAAPASKELAYVPMGAPLDMIGGAEIIG